MDFKVFVGAALTAGSVGVTWIEQANEVGQLVLTVGGVFVMILTAVYTFKRIKKIDNEDGED